MFSWGGLLSALPTEETDEQLRQRSCSAVAELRMELVEDFPSRAAAEEHPIGAAFWNQAQWTREWLVRLERYLAILAPLPDSYSI